MKALGILVRLVCSLLVLVAVALYQQAGVCNISPEQFAATVTPESVTALFTSLNWVSITAAALVLLALLRILDMAWNVAFCLSFVPVLFCGLYAAFGESAALPTALHGNAEMLAFCTLPQSYPVPALIMAGIFALGWLASTAAFRIAVTSLVSFGLWYGITYLLHTVIVMHWADTPEPAQPEILAMVLANPWMMAALPGAFFLVYAVLVSFFETFLSKKKPAAKKAEEKKEDAKEETKKEESAAKPEANPAAVKPSTSPLPGVPKATLKKPAAAKPAAKAEEKPAEPKKEEAPKAEEKPAEPKKDEAPKAEEKPAEPKKEEAPKAEEKPAEPKKEEAPKVEEKPAEPEKEEAPKA